MTRWSSDASLVTHPHVAFSPVVYAKGGHQSWGTQSTQPIGILTREQEMRTASSDSTDPYTVQVAELPQKSWTCHAFSLHSDTHSFRTVDIELSRAYRTVSRVLFNKDGIVNASPRYLRLASE